jgi:hypothetical protein
MSQSQSTPATHTMPCRGCLPNCPNRATCEGKPWRQDTAQNTKKH